MDAVEVAEVAEKGEAGDTMVEAAVKVVVIAVWAETRAEQTAGRWPLAPCIKRNRRLLL